MAAVRAPQLTTASRFVRRPSASRRRRPAAATGGGRHRAPAHPPGPPDPHGAGAAGRGDDARDVGRHGGPQLAGREGHEEGEDRQRDAGQPARGRAGPARSRRGLRRRRGAGGAPARRRGSRRRRRRGSTTSTSALTNRTTRPWMTVVRFVASVGPKTAGSRLPHRGAVDQRAEQERREARPDRRVAAQQRDRDPQEPSCVRLDVVRRDRRNSQPRTSIEPASPASCRTCP